MLAPSHRSHRKKSVHGRDDDFLRSQQPLGVILAHLGTPDQPTTQDVRRYLAEFLGDPRVVELPRWQWWPILYGVVLTLRPKRSAAAYARIWRDEGSPLRTTARQQQIALQTRLGDGFQVALCMRYGEPAMEQVIDQLWQQGCRSLVVVPMYPQYSSTTTASVHDALSAALGRRRALPSYRFIHSYHDHPAYIAALIASVDRHWQQHGRADRLLISFHGTPQRYADAGDPYLLECRRTATLLTEGLALNSHDWQLTFQSRMGREPWLTPYTDETLQKLAERGVATVDVICPGFSTDCLETLDEIANENSALFTAAGGEELRYIPALNCDFEHITLLQQLVTGSVA
ncbi:MAG: ferrochelatase [Mariprofundales bacterium]|nr:ferrochelatase [Mariprofundales bacterium]